MQCGEIVGIRGPFGRGFPIDEMRGHDVLLVAGGLGIAPLRSLINNIHDEMWIRDSCHTMQAVLSGPHSLTVRTRPFQG